MSMLSIFAASAAFIAAAAPAAAQYYPPQSYPSQTYPQQGYPQQGYPQQASPGYGQPYGYNQGYAQNSVSQIVDQLLGNRYNVSDRQAVSQCVSAAMAQAQAQYPGHAVPYGGYGQQGYQQGFAAPSMRVTAITEVQRRNNGLRVKGLMTSGYAGRYANPYGYQNGQEYGYRNDGYAQGDLTFRCSVDYRGAVTNIRIGRNDSTYRRY